MSSIDARSPRLSAVTLAGAELTEMSPCDPAASVRLLVPRDGAAGELPEWNGNEFLHADGSRPAIRTLTPRRLDPSAGSLVVEVVHHDEGALVEWLGRVRDGDEVAVSGPGRGVRVDPSTPSWLLMGDESAIPAIATLLEAIPSGVAVTVVIEVDHPSGRTELPAHPASRTTWIDRPQGSPPGDTLVTAVGDAPIDDGTEIWVAGEAAAVQRVRTVLFDQRGIPRGRTTVRGYWKHGRRGAGS